MAEPTCVYVLLQLKSQPSSVISKPADLLNLNVDGAGADDFAFTTREMERVVLRCQSCQRAGLRSNSRLHGAHSLYIALTTCVASRSTIEDGAPAFQVGVRKCGAPLDRICLTS